MEHGLGRCATAGELNQLVDTPEKLQMDARSIDQRDLFAFLADAKL
jgi:hypothetical protein